MSLDKVKNSLNAFIDTKYIALQAQHKALIAAAALLIPVVVFGFMFVSPKNKEIKGLQKNKLTLEQEISKAEAVARQLDKHKAEMVQTGKLFEQASELLPQKKEIPSLLTNISSQGTSSGLDFLSFKPAAERMQDFYAEIPVDISVNGSYHNVAVFLDKVSRLDRIVTAQNLSMGAPKIEDGEAILSTKLSLVTYRFIEPAEAQKAQAQNAAQAGKRRR